MSIVNVVTVGVSLYGAYSANKNAKSARRAGAQQSEAALEFQKEQAALLEKQKEVYRSMEFENPYTEMENVYEDLEVNKQQAEFQAEQGAQQRADILGQLRGAAGGAGIAGLAQTLANQGQLQAQQISASIGQQEARNQQLRARGAGAADMAERGGQAMMQQVEMDRQATLLGMAQAGAAGANTGLQSAYSNQMMGNLYGAQGQTDALMNLAKQDWSFLNKK
jgi:hypothetical protein